MGNINLQLPFTRNNPNDEEIYDLNKIYWDNDGNLRHGASDRKRDDEIMHILEADSSDESDKTKLWMIIPSRWIRLWLQFAYMKLGEPPGPIDMWPLMQNDPNVPGGWRPKKTLKPPLSKLNEVEFPGHYRRISLQAWLKFVDLYSIQGYAIAVRGAPYDDLTRWRVFKDPKVIDINLLPEPIIVEEKIETKKTVGESLLSSLKSGFGIF
mmetsp:Transcript_22786/g.20700  ORF Transcript_22786/g.20700 Transcript_22786/m.20700 type:complete len:210 (-) Transcript_22786:33-662(-)